MLSRGNVKAHRISDMQFQEHLESLHVCERTLTSISQLPTISQPTVFNHTVKLEDFLLDKQNMAVFIYILLGIFCLQQTILTFTSSSRINQRLTTAELRLDVINNEITHFRANIAEMTENFYQLNSSCSCTEQIAEEVLPAEQADNNAGKEVKELNNAGKSTEKEFNERIYLAFQAEKKAMLTFQQDIIDKLKDHEIHTDNISEINVNRINSRITATEKMAADIDRQVKATNLSLVEQISDLKIQLSDYKTQLSDYKTQLSAYKAKYQNMQTQIIELKGCPSQWYQHGSSCYYLSSVAKSWFKAADWCRWNNGYLIEYNDLRELLFVKSMADTLGTWNDNEWESFWVGGNDIDEEGTFRWSVSNIQLTYRNKPLTSAEILYWLPGQPSDYNGEDCMTSTVNRDGMWNDAPCKNSYLFVCEKKSS